MDRKQQNEESIRHLIPYFKGALPATAQPAFASDSDIEEERRKYKMENDGAYLMECIKVK